MAITSTTSPAEHRSGVGTVITGLRCLWLLIALAGLLAAYPYLLTEQGSPSALLLILTSAVLISGVYAVCRTGVQVVIASALLLPALCGNWWELAGVHPAVASALMLSESCFYLYAIALLMRYVLRGRVNLLDKLFGVLSVYLLIGLAFFTIFELLHTLSPGSFRGPDNALAWSDILFFSYITLTTLGYGDITPATPAAQSLATLEVIVGVFYMAVLVAWLVGSLGAIRAAPSRE